MSDLKLSNRWSITLHDPSAHFPCSMFGQFSTISEFWKLFNIMLVEKDMMNTLPLTTNITIYRDNLRNKPKSMRKWHGEWNIELNHKTNPSQIYQSIVLLVIGEQLTNKIRGIVLQRIADKEFVDKLNFSISIFTNIKDSQLNVKNILLSNNVINLDYCVQKLITFQPFQLINVDDIASDIDALHNNNNINNNKDEDESKQSEQEYVPSQSIPCVKYSMESLMEYSKLIHQQQYQRQLLDFKYRDYVLRAFGEHINKYNFRVIENKDDDDDILPDKLAHILSTEGCVICMKNTLKSPYCGKGGGHKKNTKLYTKCVDEKDEKETEEVMEINDDSSKYSFIIAQCPGLGCQHVIHCQCILNANNHIDIRNKHCSAFFKAVDLSDLTNQDIQKKIGYHINTADETDKKYQFSFKINHLISNQNTVSPQWPIRVSSYHQEIEPKNPENSDLSENQENVETKENVPQKQECLQIFFDNTELQVSTGTIHVAIFTDNDPEKESKTNLEHELMAENDINGDKMFMHNANFEIPLPTKTEPKDTKIYQLRYIDPISNNILIINVNMKLKPNFALQLLSLRYEFDPHYDSSAKLPPDVAIDDTTSITAVDDDNISELSGVTKLIESLPLGTTITVPVDRDDAIDEYTSISIPTPSISPFSSPSPLLNAVNAAPFIPTPPPPPPSQHVPLQRAPLLISTGAPVHHIPVQNVPVPISLYTTSPALSVQLQIPFQAAAASAAIMDDLTRTDWHCNPATLYHHACTELGSHYICQKLPHPIYFKMFFDKLTEYFPLLMVNGNGHIVCRALYNQSHCTLANRLILLNTLIANFVEIATNRQGSFALICLMSLMTTNTEIQVITNAFISCMNYTKDDDTKDNARNSKFDKIITSQSGYHVIKKFIGFGYPHFNCILNGISADFTKYATHHYGVPIIRSILDMMSINEHLIYEYQHCLQLFAQHTHSLICNQYGNYVIQQLLEISPQNVTDTIKEFMTTKYSENSQHKFASNVVEKCLKHTLNEIKLQMHSDEEEEDEIENQEQKKLSKTHKTRKKKKIKKHRRNWVRVIVTELLSDAPLLINHKYGNYCLQTALSAVLEVIKLDEQEINAEDNYLLLDEFVNTTYPLLHLLRLNVKKKWQQLLRSATRYHHGN